MISQWLKGLNCILACLVFLLGVTAGIFWLKRPKEVTYLSLHSKESGLPKNSFELSPESYTRIGSSLFALEQAPPTLQLPDLRQQLHYYGKNGRPDAQSDHLLLHFSLGANKVIVSIPPREKLYLIFDRKTTPGRYIFSPNNEKSSLWLEASLVDSEVQIQLTLENDKGEKIQEPEAFAQFRLPEKEFIRYGAGTTWELGPYRVDGTLLARQHARWFGIDRFLERHGGEEYKFTFNKHRIDFTENEDLYSVFVSVGDCLIWDHNRWKAVTPGKDSFGYPLLVVKKIEERLMGLELWDVEGKGKVSLNLLKSSEPWTIQNSQSVLQHIFKFVGARTRLQSVFEINRERMILKPSDWLLLTTKGWKKLATPEEIDQYVKRKLIGTLFVFEGVKRKDERQVMQGSLYSPQRNEFQTVELALQIRGQTNYSRHKVTKDHRKDKDDDEEDDEDDDDDEDDEDEEFFPIPAIRDTNNVHTPRVLTSPKPKIES
jgi:hypothetical protein